MASRIAAVLGRQKRDIDPDNLPTGWVIDTDGVPRPFWYSRTGYIVKWSLFLGLVTFIGLYLLIGYLHAKKRLRKGLVPLGYHRWLVSKRELARVDPRYAYPTATYTNYAPGQEGYYNMHPMAPPPPVYEPPSGATKLDPSQWGPPPPPNGPADQQSPPYPYQQYQQQQGPYPPPPPPQQQQFPPPPGAPQQQSTGQGLSSFLGGSGGSGNGGGSGGAANAVSQGLGKLKGLLGKK